MYDKSFRLISRHVDDTVFNEMGLKNHHIALRNLQRIITRYNIPSFTLYNNINIETMNPDETSIKTTYFANSTDLEEYVV